MMSRRIFSECIMHVIEMHKDTKDIPEEIILILQEILMGRMTQAFSQEKDTKMLEQALLSAITHRRASPPPSKRSFWTEEKRRTAPITGKRLSLLPQRPIEKSLRGNFIAEIAVLPLLLEAIQSSSLEVCRQTLEDINLLLIKQTSNCRFFYDTTLKWPLWFLPLLLSSFDMKEADLVLRSESEKRVDAKDIQASLKAIGKLLHENPEQISSSSRSGKVDSRTSLSPSLQRRSIEPFPPSPGERDAPQGKKVTPSRRRPPPPPPSTN
eukprot:TRINITY_DN28673_c0_g1_i3.p1 TRINITY_DN28673_c0_g1~~TRINITY_DN28673_c0_g1_i3.p1  ORF type:complete len:267 (-),score=19.87 TRINITY_DN28673_c0_g1_i3:70-870(-)